MAQRFPKQKCVSSDVISKAAVIGSLPEDNPMRTFLESLPEDAWSTTSFDPQSREVCINIENQKLGRTGANIVVILPEITF